MDFEGAKKYLEKFISYEEIKDFNYGEDTFNLDRLKKFLESLKIDYSKLKFVHVGGSKAKGSVSTIIAQYLWNSGYKVGLFTSPHILEVTERFCLNGENISKKKLVEIIEFLKDFCDDSGLTYFEILTVVALKFFVDEDIDYAVLEVGLGGRLDSTNIVNPELSIITTIEKEHTEILGDTYKEIVNEKLGIVKEGRPVLIGFQNDEVMELIKSKLKGKSETYYVGELVRGDLANLQNKKVAYKALEILLGHVDEKKFLKIIQDFKMLGRFDFRKIGDRSVLFDMAHTKRSIENLINSLKANFHGFDFIFLVSLMQGKDSGSILKFISENAERIVYTNSHEIRGMKAQDLANIVEGEVIEDLDLAFNSLFEKLKKDQVLVVTGSHFLVSKILSKLS